jgi:hypothetical protein
MTLSVRHDAFARGSYTRTCHTNASYYARSCDWCGRTPRRLFSYDWRSDGDNRSLRLGSRTRFFCNLDCRDSYHYHG